MSSGAINLRETPVISTAYIALPWFRGTAVERRSSAGVLSLSCARPVADE